MSTKKAPRRTATAAAVKNNPKKTTTSINSPRTSLASLSDNLQSSILVHVPFEHLSQLRLVCSRWNKIATSTTFGQAVCIKAYGDNIAPLKIKDLANLSSAADSDLSLIPTVTREGVLSVNWLQYYELRFLFQQHIDDWKEESYSEPIQFPTSSELSYVSVKTMLNDNFDNCYSSNLTPFLLKLVPLLVQYKRIDVAASAVAILTSYEREGSLLESEQSYVSLASGFLDVLAIAVVHFPVYVKSVFDIVTENTRRFTECVDVLGPTADPAFYRKTFKAAIVAMIHEGARGPLESKVNFKEYFKQPWSRCYQNLLLVHPTKPAFNFIADIVPTCRDEFKNSTDWRVRASALAACHATSCSSEQYRRDKFSFALTVLGAGDGNHNEVRRAAFMTIYKEMKFLGLGISPLAPFLFKSLFNGFVDAIAFLCNDEKMLALDALRQLMVEHNDQSYSEEMLLRFHQNVLTALLKPDVISSTKSSVHIGITTNLLGICAILKQRIQKYLQCYQPVLLDLAKSTVVCPEAWLALYIDIGCMVGSSQFIASVKSMIKQIETDTFNIGAPLSKARILACCKNAQKLSSSTEEVFIERVLSVLPSYILDVLDPLVEVEEELDTFASSDSDNEEVDAMEIVVDETPRGPLIVAAEKESREKLPSYLPYKHSQWTEAVASLAKAKGRTNLYKLFTFKKPAAKPFKMHKFVQPLDMSTRKETIGAYLKATMSTPEAEGVVEKIIKWSHIDYDADEEEMDEEGKLKFAQRFLHVMIARLMSGPVGVKHLRCVSDLIETLTPHLDDKHLTRYLTIVVQTLTTAKLESTHVLLELDEFQEFVLNTLETRQPEITPQLLHAMLKLRRDDPARGGFPENDFFNVLLRVEWFDLLTRLYPRESWIALRSPLLLSKPFFNTSDERCDLQRLWQIKLFGLKDLAKLQDSTVEEFVHDIKNLLRDVEKNMSIDTILRQLLPKMKLYCELCQIDSDIAELNYFNQFLFDQHKIKNALIKANKYPGEMKYYSALLF